MTIQEESEQAKCEALVADLQAELEHARARAHRDDERVAKLSSWLEALSDHLELILESRKWRLADGAARQWRRLTHKQQGPALQRELDTVWRAFEKLVSERKAEEREAGAQPAQGNVQAHARAQSRARASVVDIIVCVHNAFDDVVRCLDSLERHTNLRQHNLVLVDDGSAEPTRRLLAEAVGRLGARYRRHSEARGYTVAANRGIELRRGDHVVLLNSDTVVTPGWLEKLVVCAETQALEIGGAPVGVVGPLSNAASWQSIPECQTPAGWAVNELPPGVVLDEHAFRIAAGSMRLYPEVPLVNGFCYLITGAALAAVGMLDEIAFPRGYGEEDDYSIRLLDAGFRQRIADDCYVWHAKSKSFTAEGRAELIEDAKATRNEKHGSIRVRALNRELGANEDLLRARLCASLAAEAPAAKRDDLCSLGQGRSIAWLLPHLGVVGGVRRTIEMTGRLQGWGFDVTIYTPSGESADWLPIAASVASFAQLRGRTHDIAICTDPDIVDVFLELDARLPVLYHLHAYNRYRERNAGLDAYYGIGDGALHIANSAWTAEQIAEHCDVAQIIPGGISRKLFRPVRTRNQADIACYGSKRTRKGTHLIEKAGAGYELLKLEELNAAQEELAKHISSAFLFVSACEIEGFNFCPLEAMACGVPVVVTDDGGSREYARHDQNAIVVPEWGDPVSLRRAIERGIEDRELRSRLIEGGLKTAWGFTWDGVTADLADCLTTHLRARD